MIIENLIPRSCEIYTDPLLSSVFGNLIDNALRHGGTVTRISFTLEQASPEYQIICQDDGAGIVQSEKIKIFRPGYGKNTGYGLFLIREILAISDITISEDGIPEKGARFVLHIPKKLIRLYDEAG